MGTGTTTLPSRQLTAARHGKADMPIQVCDLPTCHRFISAKYHSFASGLMFLFHIIDGIGRDGGTGRYCDTQTHRVKSPAKALMLLVLKLA